MISLAQQQQVMLEALFARPAENAEQRLSSYTVGLGTHPLRGMRAYQANGHFLAERALLSAYPVIAQILGMESFANLARALWHTHPPAYGDIEWWGSHLAEFMQGDIQLEDLPYLADTAHAEWALHCAAKAPDRAPSFDSLALLTTEDPQDLTLLLAPGLFLLESQWPVASVVLAHQDQSVSLAEVGAMIQRRTAQNVVVWRYGFQPRLREALAGEYGLLMALRSGVALGPAVDASGDLDFAAWLPLAVQTGLVLGVQRRTDTQIEEDNDNPHAPI